MTKENKVAETLELVVQELQSRIGQITSQYETQLAVLKVHVTQELESRDKKISELEEKVNGTSKTPAPKN